MILRGTDGPNDKLGAFVYLGEKGGGVGNSVWCVRDVGADEVFKGAQGLGRPVFGWGSGLWRTEDDAWGMEKKENG